MAIDDVFPRFGETGAVLVCKNLSNRTSKAEYAVPVNHRRLGAAGGVDESLMAGLPDLRAVRQLVEVLRETGGVTLFAPTAWEAAGGSPFEIATVGSVIVLPPEAWEEVRADFLGWQKGMEEAWKGVPYGPEDVLVFAKVNYSPDGWFIVLRGEMAGKVVRWSHDNWPDMSVPWAEDLRGWAERLWAETPEIFGGVIRFDESAAAAETPAPEDAELFPVRLEAGRR
jgi:hypothetical protein